MTVPVSSTNTCTNTVPTASPGGTSGSGIYIAFEFSTPPEIGARSLFLTFGFWFGFGLGLFGVVGCGFCSLLSSGLGVAGFVPWFDPAARGSSLAALGCAG